jgi:hypothetical protein
MKIPVSVVCSNCGNTVVFNVETGMTGGFCETCYNCCGHVTGSYECNEHGNIRLWSVRTLGGYKKK